MSTLYIDRKDLYIKLDGDAIALYCNGKKEGLAPIKPLKRVIISGRVIIDARVLHRLADENISVLFLSGKRLRFRGMLHGRLHNNAILRVMQYRVSLSHFSLIWSTEIISRKIERQITLLQDALERRPDCRRELTRGITTLKETLGKIQKTGMIGKEPLRGLEGGAASTYFSAYTSLFPPSLGFKKRQRRPPKDPVNAMLSLTYTLLHYEAVRELEVIGLDPLIGFYHDFEYGRESLASDLIEPLRPLVDRWIWEIFSTRLFTGRDFTTGNERPGCYLKKEGRRRYYFHYEEWARSVRSLLIDDVRDLARRIMTYGENPVSK